MRHYSGEPDLYGRPGDTTGRMFAAIPFTHQQLAPTAAHCQIALTTQSSWTAGLRRYWQIHVTCTPSIYMGGPFDTEFAKDPAFAPGSRGG